MSIINRYVNASLDFGVTGSIFYTGKIHYKKDELLLSFMDSIAKFIPHTIDERVIWEITSEDKLIAYLEFFKEDGYKCKLLCDNVPVSAFQGKSIVCKRLAYDWESTYSMYYWLMSLS